MPRKKALITGVTGQDGSYLAELLLSKGYEVHGLRRRSSTPNIDRVKHIYQDPRIRDGGLYLHYGDVNDSSNLVRLVENIEPDEVYNLAAQSHVKVSFEIPEYTANVDALGSLRLLEAIRILGLAKRTRYYQASSSEMFGNQEIPQKETTPFCPRSPYGAAKLYAHWITVNYREAYNIWSCNGILFNHESPRRDPSFVSRKITTAVARIAFGLQDKLYLGNLDAKRDWGYAPEFVEAMWRMLQQPHPDDYVIATGETHSVREFVEEAFSVVGIEIYWKGQGVHQLGIHVKTGKELLAVDPWYFRPTEIDLLVGDASKARVILGWKAQTGFPDLVRMMVAADLRALELELMCSHPQNRPQNTAGTFQ